VKRLRKNRVVVFVVEIERKKKTRRNIHSPSPVNPFDEHGPHVSVALLGGRPPIVGNLWFHLLESSERADEKKKCREWLLLSRRRKIRKSEKVSIEPRFSFF